MASTFSRLFFCLFCFLLLSSFSSAGIPDSSLRSSSTAALSPKKQAEKLIRALNLSQKESLNVIPLNSSIAVAGPMLVEKRLNLTILGDSGSPSVQDLGHHAGYYRLPRSKAARMFYFFFESRNNTEDPVVIWLTGGPGCSSELALFYENGPFKIAKNMSLVWNNFGWDKVSNLLYVDQPIGTGFSYSSNKDDVPHDETGVSNDLFDFLQAFFKKHPKYAKNDFYITGESYAGHYIPALAGRINKGNKAKEGIHVNLKGFAIGNGLTNPAIQYKAYTDYALENKLIKESDYEKINKELPECEQATKSCGTNGESKCMNAYQVCTQIFNDIMDIAGDLNYYDIRKQCEGSMCYDFSRMEDFLNEKSVRAALGVGDIEFVSCSFAVHEAMMADWMRNLEVGVPALLEDGIEMLVYAGEYDLICNWIGNSEWVHAMEWSGQKAFGAASNVSFVVDGKKAGELKNHGPLSFLKVHDAGHMVPMDQPNVALHMLKSWIEGKIAKSETKESL